MKNRFGDCGVLFHEVHTPVIVRGTRLVACDQVAVLMEKSKAGRFCSDAARNLRLFGGEALNRGVVARTITDAERQDSRGTVPG